MSVTLNFLIYNSEMQICKENLIILCNLLIYYICFLSLFSVFLYICAVNICLSLFLSLYQLRQMFMISVHHSPLVWPRASFPPGVAPCIIPPGVAPCIFPPGVAPCIIPPGVAPFLSVRNGIQEKLKLRCVSRVFLHYVPKHSNRNIYQYINISIPVTPERAARHIQIQHIKIHTEY